MKRTALAVGVALLLVLGLLWHRTSVLCADALEWRRIERQWWLAKEGPRAADRVTFWTASDVERYCFGKFWR